MNANTNGNEFTMECKPFSSESRGVYRLRVATDGTGAVSVWDAVAGHFTTCHVLPFRSCDAARGKARSVNSSKVLW